MTKGPHRLVLDQYLDTASEGALKGAGANWTQKANDLDTLGAALKRAAQQAELRIGEQTLTGPAVRASMEESAASLAVKSEQLHAAGTALTQVGQQLADTRESRDSLADLGPKPAAYQAPPNTTGVETTPEELKAQADASQARANERSAWQTQYDKQEAKSLALTREMDAGFLAAIPPMKEIHGQKDPTEPPPNVPAGPGGQYLPGTQAPPVTGGGGNGGGGGKDHAGLIEGRPVDNGGNGNDDDDDGGDDDKGRPVRPVRPIDPVIITEKTPVTPLTPTTPIGTEGPTTTVTGSSQSGISYQPGGSQVSAPGSRHRRLVRRRLGSGPGCRGRRRRHGRRRDPTGRGGCRLGRQLGPGPGDRLDRSRRQRRAHSPAQPGPAAAPPPAPVRPAAPPRAAPARQQGAAPRPAAAPGAAARAGAAPARVRARAPAPADAAPAARAAPVAARVAAAAAARARTSRPPDRDRLVYDQDWLGDDDVAPGVLD